MKLCFTLSIKFCMNFCKIAVLLHQLWWYVALPLKVKLMKSNSGQQGFPPKISNLLLLLCLCSPTVSCPQVQITHIPDKLMSLYMHHAQHINKLPQQLENGRARDEESRRQQEMFDMLKYSQRLLYTVIATIGIPVVLLVVFYIDVSGICRL